MIGKTISHYKILEKLGEGGMGEVYKAEDTKLKRLVALKFLPPSFSSDKEAKQRLIHEAQSASSLDHPNICTIYEIGETDDGKLFIVMAYYRGETLKDKIAKEPIEIKEAINIIIQICEGLGVAHKNEIIHRDIKPANIFITNDGVVKILDFGLAKAKGQTQLTKIGTTVGTISYMSPEQTSGDNVNERTDIWSLGVVFYEMLTGELPFKGDYEQAIIYSIINEEPELIFKKRKDVPLQIEKIISKALNKNPQKRFNNFEELLEDLKSISESSAVSRNGILHHWIISRQKWVLKYLLSFIFLAIVGLTSYLFLRTNVIIKKVSIALLPLKNISSESKEDWFTDGMTEALITDLAKIGGLRVISRSSVMKFKSANKTSAEIAQTLGVSYLIEGSVLKINNQIKITTRLIDAAKDEYLWAQDYERDFKDILSLQSEVAQSVAEQIKVKITPYEQNLLTVQHKINPEAYEAYLKGNFYSNKLDRQSLETALKCYNLAVKIDTQCALAYAGIAWVWIVRAQNGYESVQMAYGKANIAALKAIQLDNTLSEVHYMMGNIKTWGYWKWQEAESEYKKSIQLNPNLAETRAYYSHLLFALNRSEEAIKQIKLAMELDPFNSLYQGLYAMGLMYRHRYDNVINMLEKLRKTEPNGPLILSTLKSAYHMKGMYKKAIEIWEAAFEINKDNEAIKTLENGYAKGGYPIALKSLAKLMIKRSKTRFVTPWQIATLYTRAGMKNEAIYWLEKALETHDPNMPYINVDPIFDYLRDEPRFKNIIRKIGV